jgi:hypothetical protein
VGEDLEITKGTWDEWGGRRISMGYNTDYSLNMEPFDEDIFKLILDDINEGYNPFEDPCKWYEWEEDMRRVSSYYPTFLFHLRGQGDENDDIWEATFKNGKAHIRNAQIIVAPFEEDKLE